MQECTTTHRPLPTQPTVVHLYMSDIGKYIVQSAAVDLNTIKRSETVQRDLRSTTPTAKLDDVLVEYHLTTVHDGTCLDGACLRMKIEQ